MKVLVFDNVPSASSSSWKLFGVESAGRREREVLRVIRLGILDHDQGAVCGSEVPCAGRRAQDRDLRRLRRRVPGVPPAGMQGSGEAWLGSPVQAGTVAVPFRNTWRLVSFGRREGSRRRSGTSSVSGSVEVPGGAVTLICQSRIAKPPGVDWFTGPSVIVTSPPAPEEVVTAVSAGSLAVGVLPSRPSGRLPRPGLRSRALPVDVLQFRPCRSPGAPRWCG